MIGNENSDDATPNDIAEAENTATLGEATPQLPEADHPEGSTPFNHAAAGEAIGNAAKELSDGAAQPEAAASEVLATATDGEAPSPSDEPGPAEAHQASEPDAVARDVTAQNTDDAANQSEPAPGEEPAAPAAAEAKPAGGGSPVFCDVSETAVATASPDDISKSNNGSLEGAVSAPSTIPIGETRDLRSERASEIAAKYREIVDYAVRRRKSLAV
jgi:hypothetical protein